MVHGDFTSERQLVFFEEQKHCNVKFVCPDPEHASGKSTIEAHQLVLAMSSEVFEALFYGSTAKGLASAFDDPTKALVEISDIKMPIFKEMLSAMYGKEIQLKNVEMACEFYYAVHKYNFKDALVFVENYLLDEISAKNSILIFETAETFGNVTLKEACLGIFKECTLEVLTTESFLDAEISTIETIFKMDYLKIDSEMELVKALERYIKNSSNIEIIEKLRPAINSIRFLTLSLEQLPNVVSLYPILSSDEILNIMSCLPSDEDCSKMPKDLSVIRQKRHDSEEYIKMIRSLSDVYSSKLCPCCAKSNSRFVTHPIWECCNIICDTTRLQEIYRKYNHVSLTEYSYDDLVSVYKNYVYMDYLRIN